MNATDRMLAFNRWMMHGFVTAVLALLVAACGTTSTTPAPPSSGALGINVLAPEGLTEVPRPAEGMRGMMSGLRYPDGARASRAQGRVLVEFVVSETGETRDVVVARSSGSSALDREAVRLVSETEFVPGRLDDDRVAVRMMLPITFRL